MREGGSFFAIVWLVEARRPLPLPFLSRREHTYPSLQTRMFPRTLKNSAKLFASATKRCQSHAPRIACLLSNCSCRSQSPTRTNGPKASSSRVQLVPTPPPSTASSTPHQRSTKIASATANAAIPLCGSNISRVTSTAVFGRSNARLPMASTVL